MNMLTKPSAMTPRGSCRIGMLPFCRAWPQDRRDKSARRRENKRADLGKKGYACYPAPTCWIADALDLGRVQGIHLAAALAAVLRQHPLGEVKRPHKGFAQALLIGDLAADVADDAAEIGPELAQRLAGALELMGVGVALMLHQRELADPGVRLAQAQATLCASRTSISRARFISLASVGNATAFSCTVVSITIRERSEGFIASVRAAAARLFCNKACRCSAPMRWRQRVSDERSKASRCRKSSSPQKY